jgi:hypothetical protein
LTENTNEAQVIELSANMQDGHDSQISARVYSPLIEQESFQNLPSFCSVFVVYSTSDANFTMELDGDINSQRLSHKISDVLRGCIVWKFLMVHSS